jgi:hypothetical protein
MMQSYDGLTAMTDRRKLEGSCGNPFVVESPGELPATLQQQF